MLTFIAEYPTDETIRDGMMIRIKEIDTKYAHFNRCYLDISLIRKRKNAGKATVVSNQLTIYHLNFFLDFFKLYRLISNSEKIYVQTIFNYVKVLVFINILIRNKTVALDLHGAIPEELAYQGRKLQSKFYSLVEKYAFQRVNHFIHVTHAMKAHFLTKYPSQKRTKFKDYVLGIFTTLDVKPEEVLMEKVKKELAWESSQVWIIYSGGTQQWQNMSLMLETIKKINEPNYRFLFLSGQYNTMCNLVKEAGLQQVVKVFSVSPDALKEYYSLAHYGFVLRDTTVVNKVSNPTKLSEYLAFGITPIVLEPRIGDYFEMDYEFIQIANFTQSLKPHKSLKNQNIFKNYVDGMNAVILPF